MQQYHTGKSNLWSKMRSSTKQLSSSLAHLSLRTEHDGDSEESTLIHKALVAHYNKTGQPFPEWLGVSAQQQQQQQQEQYQHHNNTLHQSQQGRQTHSAPSSGTRTGTSSGSSVADKYRRAPASSSFKDIYNSGSAPAGREQHFPQQNQQYQQHSAPNGNGRPIWGQRDASVNDNAGGRPQVQRQESSTMRDRLKRNNYRSNFNI
ncbi:CYFA0S04e01222g1_1 [Cyberlindnera fabianii]|uniref:CYFA0S04e01222g1_1 n=1 Tax=Cyberlindnera fabianii TaxID=36022 RepID=A0A061AXB0_CYBFA|nr:CYFA0S04e01222g1_1 [Cyberlindnera fabianii]